MNLASKLTAMRCKPSVVARILKLNPNPVEGSRLRGWHRKSPLWAISAVGPKQFIREHGIEAYRAVHKSFWQHRGCQKAMSRVGYLDNLWKTL